MCTTCVYPPALSRMLVVARVAELGKQVKNEDTVLEMPWASSSWNQTQGSTQRVNRLLRFQPAAVSSHSHTAPGWDGWSSHVYQHKSWPVKPTRRNQQMLWLLCLQQYQVKSLRQASVAVEIWGCHHLKVSISLFNISLYIMNKHNTPSCNYKYIFQAIIFCLWWKVYTMYFYVLLL